MFPKNPTEIVTLDAPCHHALNGSPNTVLRVNSPLYNHLIICTMSQSMNVLFKSHFVIHPMASLDGGFFKFTSYYCSNKKSLFNSGYVKPLKPSKQQVL